MKKHWKMLAITAGVAVAALSLAGVALGATEAPAPAAPAAAGACLTLTDDPAALEEMQALRAEKVVAWQAWAEKYGADRTSEEAQAALQQLREDHWSDMNALLDKYGVEVPEGSGPGSRAGQGGGFGGGGGCGGQGGGMMGGGFGGGMMGGASY